MIVIFDRQHYGKPGSASGDRGAGVDLDGDGQIESGEQEANLTPLYIQPAKALLTQLGHTVYLLDSGWYSQRHEDAIAIARANPSKRVAYLACHINAGGGDYAVFLFDSRSSGGAALAGSITDAFASDSDLTGISRSLLRSASATNDWSNAYNTVKGIYAGPTNISGVCVEPYFLDQAKHRWLTTPEGGAALAEALVDGIVRWGAG